jgi:hypothetical protein
MKKIGIAACKALGIFQVLIHLTKYPAASPAIIDPMNPIGV